MLFCSFQIFYSSVQFAQTHMAMRNERAHAKFFSEGESLAIVVFRVSNIRGIFVRRDLAQEAEGPCLIAAFSALAGEHQRAVGVGAGVLDLVHEQVRLTELHDADRVEECDSRGLLRGQALLQPGDVLIDASRPRVHVTQRCHDQRGQECNVPIAAVTDRTFEQAGGRAQLSSDGVDIRETHHMPRQC